VDVNEVKRSDGISEMNEVNGTEGKEWNEVDVNEVNGTKWRSGSKQKNAYYSRLYAFKIGVYIFVWIKANLKLSLTTLIQNERNRVKIEI
jgi:hypothetical protein